MRYRFGPFEFDPQNARLSGPGGDVPVRPMTLRLLEQLIEHAPQLLTHEQLLDRVWGRQAVTPGVVSQSVRELRRALGDSVQVPVYIGTRHRLGYCFVAPVVRVEEDGVPSASAVAPLRDGATTAAHVASESTVTRKATSSRHRILLALVLLAAAACGGWLLHRATAPVADAAYDTADVVRAGHPREPEARAWFAQGLRALGRRDLLDAQQQFEQVLRREPDAVAARIALADTFAQAGELTRAREVAHAARDAARDLPRTAQLRVGAFLAELDHRRDDAIAQWQALFQLDPGDGDAGLRLAAAQIAAARSDEATATLARLAVLDASHVDAHRLAMLRARLASASGDRASALAAAQEAFAAAGNDGMRIDALLLQGLTQLGLGLPDDARTTLERIDALLAASPWPDARMRRDRVEAALLRDTGDLPAAAARYDAVVAAARALGNAGAAVAVAREAAFTLIHAGRHADALARLAPLETESVALGDPRALAAVLDAQAVAQQRAGDQAAAEALALRALDAYLAAEDRAGEASVRSNLGMLYARDGRNAEALAQIEQALALFRGAGDQRGIAMALGNLAIQHGRAGRLDTARAATEEALSTFRAIGAAMDVARLQFNLGVQDRRAGKLAEAEARIREALDGFTRQQAEDFRLQAVATLADLLLARADLAGADAVLAAAALADATSPQRRAAVLTVLARADALRGDDEAADAGFRAARGAREAAQLPDWVLNSDLDLAEQLARGGRYAEAEQSLRRVRRAMQAGSDGLAAAQAGILLAAVQHARGDAAAAARLLDTLEPELVTHPDAMLALRLDLVRAAAQPDGRDAALRLVAGQARSIGYDLLALRTELLESSSIGGEARAELERRGIAVRGMPPALPY